MVVGLLARKTWRDLLARKAAAASLLVIVALGIAVYVAMASAWFDLAGARDRFYASARLHEGHLYAKRIPRDALVQLELAANVYRWRATVELPAAVKLTATPRVAAQTVAGIAAALPVPRRPILNDIRVVRGHWFSHAFADEVIVLQGFAEAHGLLPGMTLSVVVEGQLRSLTIVATAESPEYVYVFGEDGGIAPNPAKFAVLYFPEGLLRGIAGMRDAHNRLLLSFHDPNLTDWTLRRLSQAFDVFGVVRAERATEQVSVRLLNDEIDGLRVQARVMPAIFLAVAAMILSVVMGRMVRQQRQIIGTLAAIGMSRWTLMGHYASVGVIIAFGGSLLGVGLGLMLHRLMLLAYRDVYALPGLVADCYPLLWLHGTALALLVAVVGSARAVWRATAQAPAAAMRPPAPERGQHIVLERIAWVWSRLHTTTRLAARTLVRNPLRSFSTVVIVAVAMGLIVTTLNLNVGTRYLMEHEFERATHDEITVTTHTPVVPDALHGLGRMLPGAALETQLSVPGEVLVGAERRHTNLVGVPDDSALYTPISANGRPIRLPSYGIVVSVQLAKSMALDVGDTVQLRALLGARERRRLPVAAIADTYLGANIFLTQTQLAALLGEREVVNRLLVKTSNGVVSDGVRGDLKDIREVAALSDRRQALVQFEERFAVLMQAGTTFLLGIVCVLAFGAVLNAEMVAVSERQRELSTLRVLGMSPFGITRIFLVEASVLGAVGIALGLPLGVVISDWIATQYSTEILRFPGFVAYEMLPLAVMVMVANLLGALIIVYRQIAALNWCEALGANE